MLQAQVALSISDALMWLNKKLLETLVRSNDRYCFNVKILVDASVFKQRSLKNFDRNSQLHRKKDSIFKYMHRPCRPCLVCVHASTYQLPPEAM